MSAEPSFQSLAEMALHDPALVGMQALVVKELLHDEILYILERGSWLNDLVFQGGTALRLWYGAPRLSEDLGFSGGRDFSVERLDGLAAVLEKDLAQRCGVRVSVKPPKSVSLHRASEGVGVSSWRIDIETQPGRRDLPKQKIKLDIDNAPTYTGDLREIAQPYDVLGDLGMLVHAQNREEILANKLVAFSTSAATRNRPRYRDVWDMRWLVANGTEVRADLVRAKMRDHHTVRSWMGAAASKSVEIVLSAAFSAEMRRFLLPETANHTLDNPRYMDFLARETERLVRMADDCLPGKNLSDPANGLEDPNRGQEADTVAAAGPASALEEPTRLYETKGDISPK